MEAELPDRDVGARAWPEGELPAGGGGVPDDAHRLEERLQQALGIAYRYLNHRERTTHEMRHHLDARGCGVDEVEAAIGMLAEQGYLDDARYARMFAEDKRALQQWGSDRIARTLLSRGVERDVVEQAVGEQPRHELARALALLARRFPTPPTGRRERDRALGVLLRKGYESELALEALAAYADCAQSPAVLRCP